MRTLAWLCTFCLAAGFAAGTQCGRIEEYFLSRSRRVVFDGPKHFTLVGRVYYPPRLFHAARYPGILFVHGTLRGGKDTRLYRVLFPGIVADLGAALGRATAATKASAALACGGAGALARRLYGPRGPLARTWPAGAMGLGVMGMLLALLLSYYLF